MGLKMENPTQTLWEKVNLVLQVVLETKSKTVMSVRACERKKYLIIFNIKYIE